MSTISAIAEATTALAPTFTGEMLEPKDPAILPQD